MNGLPLTTAPARGGLGLDVRPIDEDNLLPVGTSLYPEWDGSAPPPDAWIRSEWGEGAWLAYRKAKRVGVPYPETLDVAKMARAKWGTYTGLASDSRTFDAIEAMIAEVMGTDAASVADRADRLQDHRDRESRAADEAEQLRDRQARQQPPAPVAAGFSPPPLLLVGLAGVVVIGGVMYYKRTRS